MAIVGLLFTLVVMFAMKGKVIIEEPMVVVLVAIPVTIFFFTMFAGGYFASWAFNINYQNSIVVGLTGSSNNFELAIAVAAAVLGISSRVALATVIGPLIEVPIMLALVHIGMRTRNWFPRKKNATAGTDMNGEGIRTRADSTGALPSS